MKENKAKQKVAKQKVATYPKLNNRKGDITKQWYISFTYRNPVTKKMQLFKVYENLNSVKTVQERTELAKKIVRKTWRKLQGGFNPFDSESSKAVYVDVTVSELTKRGKKLDKNKEKDFTVKQYLSEYLTDKKDLRKSSYQTYKSKINTFCKWIDKQGLTDYNIRELTTEHAKNFVESLQVSNTTVRAYISDLITIFNYLIDKKIVETNIFSPVVKPKVKKVSKKPFNAQQRSELKKHFSTHKPQVWLLVQIIYYTLIRPNEARLLTISDIDLNENTILIRAEVSKNKKSQFVAIPKELKTVLENIDIYRYPNNFYLLGKSGLPDKHCWGRETLSKYHNEDLRKLGYSEQYSLYSWKHTGAKELAKNTKNVKVVQLQCRHHSLDQTDQYLRDLGINDFAEELQNNYPKL